MGRVLCKYLAWTYSLTVQYWGQNLGASLDGSLLENPLIGNARILVLCMIQIVLRLGKCVCKGSQWERGWEIHPARMVYCMIQRVLDLGRCVRKGVTLRVRVGQSSVMASDLRETCSVMPGRNLIDTMLRSCDWIIISYIPASQCLASISLSSNNYLNGRDICPSISV
jgi:hypothetical protein